MCTDAYREALIQGLSSPASSTPAPTPASSQRHATEADREGVVGGIRSGIAGIPDKTIWKDAASRRRLSQISWRKSLAHQSTEDNDGGSDAESHDVRDRAVSKPA